VKGTTLSLLELQRWMKWIITDPRGVEDALLGPPSEKVANIERYLEPKPGARHLLAVEEHCTSSDRLSIYAEAYFSRIVESLEADFPRLRAVLGEFPFQKLAADYLKAFPSRSYNIGEVGKNLPAFTTEYQATENIPFLPELASLEWELIESFYAPNAPAFDPATVAELAEHWELLLVTLEPAAKVLRSKWPLDLFWAWDNEQNLPCSVEASDECAFLLWRQSGSVYLEKISPSEALALEALQKGETISRCLTLLSRQMEQNSASEDLETLVATLFGKWATNGIISKVTVDTKQ
jgi:hypothetical protein